MSQPVFFVEDGKQTQPLLGRSWTEDDMISSQQPSMPRRWVAVGAQTQPLMLHPRFMADDTRGNQPLTPPRLTQGDAERNITRTLPSAKNRYRAVPLVKKLMCLWSKPALRRKCTTSAVVAFLLIVAIAACLLVKYAPLHIYPEVTTKSPVVYFDCNRSGCEPPTICDTASQICKIPVMAVGMSCSASVLCVDNAYCEAGPVTQCRCSPRFAPLPDGTCGLKVGPQDLDCATVTQCVHHASCLAVADAEKSRQCVCDQEYYYPRSDGTCALRIGQKVDCSADSDCVEYGECSSASRCECIKGFVPTPSGVCGRVLGSSCNESAFCIDRNSHCDEISSLCQCNRHYSPTRSNICGLKVDIDGETCTAATTCADHAHCHARSGRCVCMGGYKIKVNGTCGLQAESKSCHKDEDCTDFAQCQQGPYRYLGVGRKCSCRTFSTQTVYNMCALLAGQTEQGCTWDSQCVAHATCNSSGQCVCDSPYYRQTESGECGLLPEIPVNNAKDCGAIECYGNATCKMEWAGAVCKCMQQDNFAYDSDSGVCVVTAPHSGSAGKLPTVVWNLLLLAAVKKIVTCILLI